MTRTATPTAVTTSRHVDEAEVLPPEGQIRTSGANLETLRKEVLAEYEQFHGVERETAWRGLRIGLKLQMGKSLCKHGQFGNWLATAIPDYGHRQANNLMSLAAAFVVKQKLDARRAFLLCENTDHPDAATAKVETAARQFVGESTLNELFYDHGIKVRPSKKIGGARDKKRGRITHEMRVESAKAEARAIIDLVHTFVCKGKDWPLIDQELLENLRTTLFDAHKKISGK